MALSTLYSAIVLEHNRAPHNFGPLAGATASGSGLNASCGDEVRMALCLDASERIAACGFEGESCAICTAVASILTGLAVGRDRADIAFVFVGDGVRKREVESFLGSVGAATACLCRACVRPGGAAPALSPTPRRTTGAGGWALAGVGIFRLLEELEKAVEQSGLVFEEWKDGIRKQMLQQELIRREIRPNFTDEEVQKYYDEHKDRFRNLPFEKVAPQTPGFAEGLFRLLELLEHLVKRAEVVKMRRARIEPRRVAGVGGERARDLGRPGQRPLGHDARARVPAGRRRRPTRR